MADPSLDACKLFWLRDRLRGKKQQIKRKNNKRREENSGRGGKGGEGTEGLINFTAPLSREKQTHLIFAFKCNPVQTMQQTLTCCRKGGLCIR